MTVKKVRFSQKFGKNIILRKVNQSWFARFGKLEGVIWGIRCAEAGNDLTEQIASDTHASKCQNNNEVFNSTKRLLNSRTQKFLHLFSEKKTNRQIMNLKGLCNFYLLLFVWWKHNSWSQRVIILLPKSQKSISTKSPSLAQRSEGKINANPQIDLWKELEELGRFLQRYVTAPRGGAVHARLIYHRANLIESHFQHLPSKTRNRNLKHGKF